MNIPNHIVVRSSDDGSRAAGFSPCERYRYFLEDWWDRTGELINFVMLNPSTADHLVNDPTITRVIKRSRNYGYGGMVVTNLFALRSTDPKLIGTDPHPVGDGNDAVLSHFADKSQTIVCAWGRFGAIGNRGTAVKEILKRSATPLRVISTTKDGHPSHPLYLSYQLGLKEWVEI